MNLTNAHKHAKRLITGLGLTALATLNPTFAQQDDPVKLGVMLPYSGTYAPLGESITNGLKLAIEQNGNKLGGRDVEYVVIDSEADASKAPQNMSRLVKGEGVDFVIGPVHSGVAMGMLRVAKQTGALMIIPNAGLGAATGQLCMPNVFRSSFSMWQDSYPMGKVAYDRGYRKVVTITWNYAGGKEDLAGFEEAFTEQGGEIVKQILVPFPETGFQPYLTDIASINPDAVYTFFAGAGGVSFVRDYAQAGLKESIPLLGSGFLTDGNLEAQGEAAEGILTTLHYGDNLDSDTDRAFRKAYSAQYDRELDTYAVQGYDAGKMMVQAMNVVGGDTSNQEALIEALGNVKMQSPRGPMFFSEAHHPIQHIYLREVKDGRNEVIGIASEALEDPAHGCEM